MHAASLAMDDVPVYESGLILSSHLGGINEDESV